MSPFPRIMAILLMLAVLIGVGSGISSGKRLTIQSRNPGCRSVRRWAGSWPALRERTTRENFNSLTTTGHIRPTGRSGGIIPAI